MTTKHKKKIYLFSYSYPYLSQGEDAFLKNEILRLSSRFDEIVIFPYIKTSEFVHPLPSNVSISNSLLKDFEEPKYKLSLLFRLALKNFQKIIRELFDAALTLKPSSLFHSIKYTLGSLKVLDWANKNIPKDVILYSYWKNHIATGLTFMNSENIIVSRAHGYDLYSERNPGNRIPYELETLSRLDKVFLISSASQVYLEKKYDGLKNKFSLSRLGVTSHLFTNQSTQKKLKEKLHIVSCSSLVSLKRVSLIHSTLLLAQKKINQPLLWTHIGGKKDDILIEKIKSYAESNLVFKHIAQISNDYIFNFYKENPIDAFISLSSSEGLPVSMMEAQSFGIPIIGTDVGGVSEIVNEDTGFLLDVGSETKGVELAIQSIVLGKFKSREERGRIKNYQLEHFNEKKNFNDFCNKIKNLS